MDQDKSLIDYEKNLQELDRQREKLEIALQMMGQEWEESGAGIAWMGSLDLPLIQNDTIVSNTTADSEASIITTDLLFRSPVVASDNDIISDTTLEPSIFKNILSATNTGPSPEYLQSLLHVNETLLAQSLANTTAATTTVVNDQHGDINPLPTTNEYTHPETSELIISPLDSTMDKKLTSLVPPYNNNHVQS